MKWNGNPTADVEYTVSRSIVMDEIEAVDQNGDIRAQMQAIYANDPNGVARVMKTNDPDVISTIRGLEETAAGGSTSVIITPNTDNKIAGVSILGAGLNATADGGPAVLVVDKPQGQHNVPAADQFRTLSFSLTLSNVSSSASLAFPIAVDLKLSSTGVDRNQLTLYHFHADGTSEQVPVNVYADPSGAEGEWYAKIYLTGLSDFVMVYSEEGGGDSGNDPVVIDSGTCGAQGDNVTWTLYDNGEMVIEGSGKIADRSFRQWNNVKSVTINDGVTSIGEYVFWECSKLSSVSIPKSVASIGGNSFAGCGSLTSIHVDPDNTAYCDSDEVLYNRDMSTLLLVPGGRQGEFVIPGSVKSIGEEAFYRCAGLTSITIPDSVSAIDTWAFGFCSGLTNMTIPAGVKSISDYSFCWCTGLQTVSIPSGVTSIGDNAFGYCYELERVIIPENVTSIGAGAFLYCRTLTSVTIPNSVTDIQGPAFALCSNLASIHVASDNPAYCDSDGVLYDKNMSALYQVPCAKSGSYVIPNDVAMISNMAFSGCSNITSIAIPESVTSIGSGAFVDCSNLTDAYYTGTQEQWNQVEIGLNNDALTSANIHLNTIPDLILPSDVTTIGDEAFAGGAFVYPLLSENTVSIGQRAFADCPSLAFIYIPEATESIDSTAFGDKTALMIYGKAGSTAEVYAEEHNFLFTAVP